jgi:hypothetical protein
MHIIPWYSKALSVTLSIPASISYSEEGFARPEASTMRRSRLRSLKAATLWMNDGERQEQKNLPVHQFLDDYSLRFERTQYVTVTAKRTEVIHNNPDPSSFRGGKHPGKKGCLS